MGSVVVLGLALVAQLLLLINLHAPRPARNPEGYGVIGTGAARVGCLPGAGQFWTRPAS
jgi:hypothetical protein